MNFSSKELHPKLAAIIAKSDEVYHHHLLESLESSCGPPISGTKVTSTSNINGKIYEKTSADYIYGTRTSGNLTDSLFHHLSSSEIKYVPVLLSLVKFIVNNLDNSPYANAGFALLEHIDGLITTVRRSAELNNIVPSFKSYVDGVQNKLTSSQKETLRKVNEYHKTRKIPDSEYSEINIASRGLYNIYFALLMELKTIKVVKKKTDKVVECVALDERNYAEDKPVRDGARSYLTASIKDDTNQQQIAQFINTGRFSSANGSIKIGSASKNRYSADPNTLAYKYAIDIDYRAISNHMNGSSLLLKLHAERFSIHFGDLALPTPLMIRENPKFLLYDNYDTLINPEVFRYYYGNQEFDTVCELTTRKDGDLMHLNSFIKESLRGLKREYYSLYKKEGVTRYHYDPSMNRRSIPCAATSIGSLPDSLNSLYFGEGHEYNYYYHFNDTYWLHIIKGIFYISRHRITDDRSDGIDDYYQFCPPSLDKGTLRNITGPMTNLSIVLERRNDDFHAVMLMEHQHGYGDRAKKQFSPIINSTNTPIFSLNFNNKGPDIPYINATERNHRSLLVITERGGKILDGYVHRNTNPSEYIEHVYKRDLNKSDSTRKGLIHAIAANFDRTMKCSFDVNFNPPLLAKIDQRDYRYDTLYINPQSIGELQSESTMFHMLRGEIREDRSCTDVAPQKMLGKYQNIGIPIELHTTSYEAAFYELEDKRTVDGKFRYFPGELKEYNEPCLENYKLKERPEFDGCLSKYNENNDHYKPMCTRIFFGCYPIRTEYDCEEIYVDSDDLMLKDSSRPPTKKLRPDLMMI